jgi:hypothetical protein
MKASCTETVVAKKYALLMQLTRDWSLVKVATFLSYLGPAANLDNGFRVQVLSAAMKGNRQVPSLPSVAQPYVPQEASKHNRTSSEHSLANEPSTSQKVSSTPSLPKRRMETDTSAESNTEWDSSALKRHRPSTYGLPQ